MDIADQNLMGMDSFGGSTYAPQRSMNQPPMYGMGGMPFGGGYGGYGGFGGFGGGYGGGFNPMFGGIGGLGFNPMFGPGFGQPMSPFGGGMGRNFGGFGGGFGGYPQFGGFGGGFGGYPQFGGFGGFGGFNPMFGGIGGLGFNPFMGPEFGRRMPQRDLRNELFGNAQKPQPAVKQVPGDLNYIGLAVEPPEKEYRSAVVEPLGTNTGIKQPDEEAKYRQDALQMQQQRAMNPGGKSMQYWQSEYNRMYPADSLTAQVVPSLDQFIQNRTNSPINELMSMFPALSRTRRETNLPAAPAGKKWFTGMSGIPRLVDANLNTAMMD